MKRHIACIYLLLAALLVAGCVPWVRVEQPLTESPDKSFTVLLPAGWVRFNPASDRILITRDGLGIHYIEAAKLPHDKAFPTIKKTANADMLPTEVAELLIAEIKSQANMEGLEVIANAPATIAGRNGFRLQLRVRNPKGLGYNRVVYGFAGKDGVYALAYQAPQLHYFERDLPAFESVVASLRLAAQGT